MLQMEEEQSKHEPPTETERLQAAANSNTGNRAEDLVTEQQIIIDIWVLYAVDGRGEARA